MKRGLPLLILLILGGAASWRIWTTGEPDRRYGRVLELLQAHRERPGASWAEADAKALWDHVAWFDRKNRDALVRRLLTSLDSEDPGERGDAALLAAHIEIYGRFADWRIERAIWRLPLPAAGLYPFSGHSLRDDLRTESFARAADDPRLDVRLSFLRLTRLPKCPAEREAYLRRAAVDESLDVLCHVLPCLDLREEDVARILDARAAAGEIRARFLAAAVLASRDRPEGTRLFVDLLTDLKNDLPPEDRDFGVRIVDPALFAGGTGTLDRSRRAASRGSSRRLARLAGDPGARGLPGRRAGRARRGVDRNLRSLTAPPGGRGDVLRDS